MISETRQRRTAVCTIISKNYLAMARTLMQSVAGAHPDWHRYVLLVDRIDGYFQPEKEPFQLISIDELPLPKKQQFLFRYTLLEVNTAVKPWLLEWVFAHTSCEHVVYLDPDIYVYRPLLEVQRLLDGGALMVLTPHLTEELNDGWLPGEREILLAGVYNLGFLALSRHAELKRFLAWWQSRLEHDCRVDLAAGLFVDQRWMDLTPGLFAGVEILRHPGYNLAYWNLKHRPVRLEDNGPWVGEDPLCFFHFSGLDPAAPENLSRHQTRFVLKNLGPAGQLVEDYSRRVLDSGWQEQRRWPYAFGFLDDGTPIIDSMRHYYRSQPRIQKELGDNPFADTHEHLNRPWGSRQWPLVTRLMHQLWKSRANLQEAFPDLDGVWREPFAACYVETLATEAHIPDRFVTPVRDALQQRRDLARQNTPAPPPLALFEPDAEEVSHPASLAIRMMARLAVTVLPLPRSREGLMGLYHFLRPLRWVVPSFIRSQLRRDLHRWLLRRHTARRSWSLSHLLTALGRGLRRLLAMLSWTTGRAVRPATVPPPSQARSNAQAGRPAPALRLYKGPAVLEGMNLVGYLGAESGIGESARLWAQAATAVGLPFSRHDFTAGSRSRAADRRWVPQQPEPNDYPVNLFHINADQMALAHDTLGADFFAGRYNIGYWHWELPELPDRYLPAFNLVDEIWVPSRFVQDAIAERSPRPVLRIPHAISFAVGEQVSRADFGLPAKDFLFLMMYDTQSFQERKNPEGAVEAFRRAFAGSGHVTLLIKVNNATTRPAGLERLRDCVAGMSNVVLLERALSRQEAYNLLGLCDCFVSLHRSEGFGLGLAEAMFLGKPVVATAWSGNQDFMTPATSAPVHYRLIRLQHNVGPYECGELWADPDLDHAAHLMKKVVSDVAWRQQIAAAGQATIRQEYSPQRIGNLYWRRLRSLLRGPAGALMGRRTAA